MILIALVVSLPTAILAGAAIRWWWLSEPPLGPVAIDDYLAMLADVEGER